MKKKLYGKRANSIMRKYLSRLEDIFSNAIHFKLTHEDILDELEAKIFSTEEWQRLPLYSTSYVNGYWEAKRNELYKYHLAWVLWCDDRLMTSQEVNELTEAEKRQPELLLQDYKSPWSRIDSNKSRHCWKDLSSNKPLLEKPFDRRFI